jgi:hypothetical protein
MNLVFGSVLLLTFIAPGIIFRFSYLQGPYSKQSFKPSAIDELFWALIPALFFHLLGILFIENATAYTVKLRYVYSLITGASDIDFSIIRRSLAPFLLYNFVLIGVSLTIGLLLRRIVRYFKLDIRFNFLRMNNDWDYVFSGEILDFPSVLGESGNIELIKIDAMVRSQEGTIIYSGVLHDYFLSKDNGLDRIYLKLVYRRRLDEDRPQYALEENPVQKLDERYYAMPGDLFVVFYKDVINLNITYHRFSFMEDIKGEIAQER